MFCFLESCSTIVTIRFVNIGFSFIFGKIFTSCTHVYTYIYSRIFLFSLL